MFLDHAAAVANDDVVYLTAAADIAVAAVTAALAVHSECWSLLIEGCTASTTTLFEGDIFFLYLLKPRKSLQGRY